MLIAYLYLSGRRILHPIFSMAFSVLFFLTIGMLDIFSKSIDSRIILILYAISSALIIYSLVTVELTGKFAFPKWTQFLGGSSYSLYLSHFFVLSFIMKILLYFEVKLWMPAWIAWFYLL